MPTERASERVSDDVVAAACDGDAAALTSVYTAFAPSVAGYLRAKGVGDPEASTSEVFLAVLPRLSRLTGGAQGLRTLLFSIAHARMVDEHRSRSRRPEQVAYEPELDERTVESAEDAAHAVLGTARVSRVLALLPADQREVIALRIVGDLSIEQVAHVIGRSAGAVKQLQRRGLVAIRRALAEQQISL